MSTAQKTKSTSPAMRATSDALPTVRPATEAGTGAARAQRPATASAYLLPAELALAATSVTSYQGWFASSDTNLWPTMPVAPRTPTLSFFAIVPPSERKKAGQFITGGSRAQALRRGHHLR